MICIFSYLFPHTHIPNRCVEISKSKEWSFKKRKNEATNAHTKFPNDCHYTPHLNGKNLSTNFMGL